MIYRGVVKWFDEIKGYGYIQAENGQEIFVHFTEILQEKGFRTLSPGSLVEFEMILGEMGPKALNVRKLPRSTPPRKN